MVAHAPGRAPSPVSGAWRAGDPIGARTFLDIGPLALENGSTLPVTLAYETWGELDADGGNAVLVLHALTGDSHARGPAGPGHPTAGWWEDLIGPGRAIDTDRYFVVAPNVLGGCQGSTGPASPGPDGAPWGSRFPAITTRDQVHAELALTARLGIGSWALVIGGSMGGMRAVEWAVTAPQQVRRLALIASCARASADQIAWNSAQLAAIRGSSGFHGGDYYDSPPEDGPQDGLGIARRIAHTTYRTASELEGRFGNRRQDDAWDQRFQVASYLDHHADKLVRRFDANSYLRLVEAMDAHDVGRGRGGLAAALSTVTARTLVVGVDTDRLFPLAMSEQIAEGVDDAEFHVIHSPLGHDGFLVTSPALAGWIHDLLGSRVGPETGGTRVVGVADTTAGRVREE